MFKIIAVIALLYSAEYKHEPFPDEVTCTEFLASDTYKEAEDSLKAALLQDGIPPEVESKCVPVEKENDNG